MDQQMYKAIKYVITLYHYDHKKCYIAHSNRQPLYLLKSTSVKGFYGKENDNEVKGDDGQQDYGMRIYDPRLGRFLSVDPITNIYPELSPYQFASNTPVWAIDVDGLEAYPITREWNADDLANFGNFINEEIARIRKAEDNGKVSLYTVYDCSDLVISMYVRYAMANGLPITLTRKTDYSKYNSSDTKGIPQWNPADPEGSKLRFELYVRDITTTATLRIDMVPISAAQAGPGDVQVTTKHAILIRPTSDIDNPTSVNLQHHYVDASQDDSGGPGGLGGSFIRNPIDAPEFRTNLYRFREIAAVEKPKIQTNEIKPIQPRLIPIETKPSELIRITNPYIPKR